MGFRKTPEEIAGIRAAFVDPIYLRSRVLAVTFETTLDAIAELLPPPLEPTRPYGACGIGVYDSSVGVWKGGGLFVPARYGDLTGQYVAAMYGDLDSPCFYGRAQFGEPKKLATVRLDQDGDHMWGSLTRHGVTIIEIDARLQDEQPVQPGPRPATSGNFNFKFALKSDASGFEWGPVLMRNTGGIGETLVARTGQGTLRFGVSPHDPLADLPIVRVRGASYSEANSYAGGKTEIVAEVDAETFYPYALGIYDALDVFHADVLARAPQERLAQARQLLQEPTGAPR
jgi:hypothetical protein